jgi:hypothetical protein
MVVAMKCHCLREAENGVGVKRSSFGKYREILLPMFIHLQWVECRMGKASQKEILTLVPEIKFNWIADLLAVMRMKTDPRWVISRKLRAKSAFSVILPSVAFEHEFFVTPSGVFY